MSQSLAASAHTIVNILRQAGHTQAALAALQRAAGPLNTLLLATAPEFSEAVREKCAATCQALVSALLPRILAEGSRPAVDLGLGYLMVAAGDKRQTLSLLARLNSGLGLDYRRVGSLALIGWRYCRLGGLAKQAEQFSQLYVKAAWGRQTADLKASSGGGGICFKGQCRRI